MQVIWEVRDPNAYLILVELNTLVVELQSLVYFSRILLVRKVQTGCYRQEKREREDRERPWRQYSKKEHTAGRSSTAPNENSP